MTLLYREELKTGGSHPVEPWSFVALFEFLDLPFLSVWILEAFQKHRIEYLRLILSLEACLR
jgi:hypothetical protein